MNQFIVILILLRNFIFNFKVTITKVICCTIALIFSLYIYEIYNDTKTQKVYVCEKCMGADINSSKLLSISLDYASPNNDYYQTLLSDTLTGTTIHYQENIFTDSVKNSSSFVTKEQILSNVILNSEINRKIDSIFISSDYLRYFYVITEYDENNWLFPHFSLPSLRKKTLESNTTNCNIRENELLINYAGQLSSDFKLPGTNNFLRRKNYFIFESVNANQEDSIVWFFNELNIPQSPYQPHYYSAYDISQINLRIYFRIDNLEQFRLHFTDLVNYAEIIPKPDMQNAHEICYTDSAKLNKITEYGLDLIVKFPRLESVQESRNYIITAFITLFITILVTSLFKIAVKLKNYRKRLITILNTYRIIDIKKFNYFNKIIVFNDIAIGVVLSFILIFINPYDWNLIMKIAIVVLGIFIAYGLFVHRLHLNKFKNNRVYWFLWNKYILKLFIIYVLYVLLVLIGLWSENSITITDLFILLVGHLAFIFIGGKFAVLRMKNKFF